MRRLVTGIFVSCIFVLTLSGCDPFGLESLDNPSYNRPIERDLAAAVKTEGRVECLPTRHDLWSCRVEGDPGSGFSGHLNLRVGKTGCWRAQHVRYKKGHRPTGSKRDLSSVNSEAFGRVITGCTPEEA